MKKVWSEINKIVQAQIKKKDTYTDGIAALFDLRNRLMNTLTSQKDELSREDFNAMPFINADGYHSKSIAYSIWHIFRIEDIVAHTLINGDEQVFFSGHYSELYSYIFEVKESTEKLIKNLSYTDMKSKISEGRKDDLKFLNVVSTDERAVWLIDYWCGKDIKGLIQMPFSRHWIMHIEASLRIKNKICSS